MQVMMKVHFTTIFLICIEQFTKAIAQGMPISPCPKVFQYRYDGSEWFGLTAIRNPDVQALQIRVTLSMRGKPTTNYLGEIELLTRGQFASNAPVLYKIRFPKHNFPPKLVLISANNQVICVGSGDHSIFMTQIQLEHTRKLTFIPDKKSSGVMVAPGGADFGMVVGKELPANNEFGSKPLPHIRFKKKPFHSPGEICGRVTTNNRFGLSADHADQSPVFGSNSDYDNDGSVTVLDEMEEDGFDSDVTFTFVDGQNTTTGNSMPSITRGAWPWLAAIYVNNLTSLNFQCGGTLISARVVISSAHCFQMFNQRYTANEVLVFLGRHNLKNWNEDGSLAAPVDGIYIHSDYNKQLSSYDADIAVIILKDEVRFNTFIQPVCLWSGSSKTEYIVGENGIVIGWSFDRSNLTKFSKDSSSTFVPGDGAASYASNSIPTVVRAPIVSNEVCFKANAHFRSLSSNRTFCAGFLVDIHKDGGRAGVSIYTGISGAGLMILKNNRWMLRGTVSAALPADPRGSLRNDSALCCTSQYVIYADVAKFIDWIMAFII
ncbi:serine protease gd isoform X2 [Drosophila montana]|uniref:serine protease gd isoform X2 n=1 Tax=Drosophila montana TaxID=40370 RepID=UPI00313E6B5D